jgi:hypothetical protein
MTVSFAEQAKSIVAANNAEEAMLFMMEHQEGVPGLDEEASKKLRDLGTAWMARLQEEGSESSLLAAFSSDENRKRYFRVVAKDSGFGTLVESIQDAPNASLLALMLEVFIEVVDDPGYFDEVLGDPSLPLTDEQQLKLVEAKKNLGR